MGVTVSKGLAIVGDYERQRARARPAHRPPALAGAMSAASCTPASPPQDGRLFVSSSTDKDLTALRLDNGHQIWQQSLHDFAFSGPAVAGNVVVAGSYDGHLRAFKATDGSLLWDVDMGGKIYGTPQVVRGVVWAASFAGNTYARRARQRAAPAALRPRPLRGHIGRRPHPLPARLLTHLGSALIGTVDQQ